MNIPKSMQEKYNEIATIIITFCEQRLNDEYTEVCLRLLETLCRKRPSPLLSGKANTWACGIVYAVGSNNFIFDKSQKEYMSAKDLATGFNLAASTAASKAGEISKYVGMYTFDPKWTLASKLADNPLIWLFETEKGFIIDIRHASRDLQVQAYEAGLIPFIPDDNKKQAPEENREEKTIVKKRAEDKAAEKVIEKDENQLTFF